MRDRKRAFSHVSCEYPFLTHDESHMQTAIVVRTVADQTTAIHSLTDTCFRKCIPAGTIKNGKLDKYEEPCMRQCVDRFLDANLVVLRELERLRQ